MTLDINELVNFLDDHGEIGSPEEPTNTLWPVLDTEQQEAQQVDWKAMFDRQDNRLDHEWSNDPELLELISESLKAGPPDGIKAEDVLSRRPEVCAWYQPIHFHGLGWGIFILEDCMRRIAADIARWLPASPNYRAYLPPNLVADLVRAAFSTLYLHEAYHHRVEAFAIRARVVDGRPRYREYWSKVYSPTFHAPGALEEALANASSYQRLSENAHKPRGAGARGTADITKATREYLKWRFPLDPPGYRDAVHYLTESTFEAGQHKLQESVDTAALPGASGARWGLAPHMTQSLFNLRSNIWTVVPRGSRSRLPVFPSFRPVSTSKLERCLTRDLGYTRVKGGKGSHIKLKNPPKPTLILPGGRKDLSPGVTRNVAKALGFSNVSDMLSELNC